MACGECNQKATIIKPAAEKTNNEIFSDKPDGYVEFYWEGSLLDFQKFNLDIDSIIRITKIADNKYVAVSTY